MSVEKYIKENVARLAIGHGTLCIVNGADNFRRL